MIHLNSEPRVFQGTVQCLGTVGGNASPLGLLILRALAKLVNVRQGITKLGRLLIDQVDVRPAARPHMRETTTLRASSDQGDCCLTDGHAAHDDQSQRNP